MTIKNFYTFINEELVDRNQSELYVPKTEKELYNCIDIAIESAKRDGTYPDVNLNNIDVLELGNDELEGLFGNRNITTHKWSQITPDISNWNIKYIPRQFFYGNKQIKEFTIPDTVTSIEHGAFEGCDRLTSVTIPDSVTRIKSYAFDHCISLYSVTIPNSVISIGDCAFSNCRCLTSVEISNNVREIGRYAFEYCDSLTSVTIPDSVVRIGDCAFSNCRCLTSVTISEYCHIEEDSFPKNCKIIRK